MSVQFSVQAAEAHASSTGNEQDSWLSNDQKSAIRANGYGWVQGNSEEPIGRVQYSCASNFYVYWVNNVRQPNRKAFIARLETLLG